MKKYLILAGFCFLSGILIYAQGEWTQTNLSSIALRMGTASQGSKVYFAGGARGTNLLPSKVIDIYDLNTKQWTTSNLSKEREVPAGVSNGNKVFFAGGINFINLNSFADVDILDVQSKKWTTEQLSQARFGIAAVSYGNLVFFAGGVDLLSNTAFSTVDIYNTATGMWSSAALSEARTAMGCAVAGTKAVFAGGFNLNTVTDRVDIFDFKTGNWSIATLSLARGFVTATAVGNKVIIAGGMTNANTPTDRVDIYDVTTGTWATTKLSAPRAFLDYAANACGKAFFVGGGNFDLVSQSWITASDIVDIYDPSSGTWELEQMSHESYNHCVIANGNNLLIAGGVDGNTATQVVDIYTCVPVGNDNIQKESPGFGIQPNPAKNHFTITLPDFLNKGVITIFEMNGNIIYTNSVSGIQKMEVDAKNFKKGLYLIQIKSKDYIKTQKIILPE